ncbi:hypothetical protein H5410_046659 [Solanum commersonii]|uniref:Uncharacterized protein n=1 Tax=Solanum commersonii TaxID=4109 RepID=A0A9J5XCW5_SOLCO|nr:hypothetical protein H5410_046659 [Solanum commersonii]
MLEAVLRVVVAHRDCKECRNDYKRDDSSVQSTPEMYTQIWTKKVIGGTHKDRVYGRGSRNDVRRLKSDLKGIGSSRHVEALDGVQITSMSNQIAKDIVALSESKRKRIVEQQA